MKILSNKEYKDLQDEIKCVNNELEQFKTSSKYYTKDLEIRINNIRFKLVKLLNECNSNIKKDTIKGKLINIITFIDTNKEKI
jgi:hypothetical protein